MGSLLLEITLKNAPATPTAPFLSQTSRFTTADVDQTLSSASTEEEPALSGTTWTHGWISTAGGLESSASADASQGKGFYAPSPEMSVYLKNEGISEAISAGHYAIRGAKVTLYSQIDNALGGQVRFLSEWIVVETGIEGTDFRLDLRDPTYELNPPIHGNLPAKQIVLDPDGNENPTDPTYFQTKDVTQFVGTALGSVPASLKVVGPVQAVKIAHWGRSTLLYGDIQPNQGVEGFVCETTALNFMDRQTNDDLTTKTGATVSFGCRMKTATEDEALRMANELRNCISLGYKIVLTDGSWFLDLSAQDLWQGDLHVSNWDNETIGSVITPASPGLAFDSKSSMPPNGYWSIVWFSVTGKDGHNLIKEGIDPKTIEVWAVPSSVGITSGQKLFTGTSQNNKTINISGSQNYSAGNDLIVFAPPLVSKSGMISVENVPFKVLRDGNVEHDSTATGEGAGTTADIKTDAADPWLDGDGEVHFGVTGFSRTGVNPVSWLNIRHNLKNVTADYFSAEMTFLCAYTFHNPSNKLDSCAIAVNPAFDTVKMRYYKTIAVLSNTSNSDSIENTADHNRLSPIWGATFQSLEEMNNVAASPQMSARLLHSTLDIDIKIREILLWAFRNVSFSSFYATVFPYWTTRRLTGISCDGGGHILAPDAGHGNLLHSGTAISWTPDAHAGNGDNSTYDATNNEWLAVYETLGNTGSAFNYRLDHSADLLTWATAQQSNAGESFGNVYALGGKAILICANGASPYIRAGNNASSLSAPINLPAGMTVIRCAAFDGTRWWFFGNAQQSAYTSNLSSFTFVSSGILSAAIAATFYSGRIYVCGPGFIAWATPSEAMAGSWSQMQFGGSLSFTSICAGTDTVTAVGVMPNGQVIAHSQASLGSWRNVFESEDKVTPNNGASICFDSYSSTWIIASGASDGSSRSLWTSTNDLATDTEIEWRPDTSNTPSQAVHYFRAAFLGGANSRNPLRCAFDGWQSNFGMPSFGIAFDPPSVSSESSGIATQAQPTNSTSGTAAQDAVKQLCEEWRMFAGAMSEDPAEIIDGTNDDIEIELPDLDPGNIEDVATILTVQYQPFGGNYLGKAYTQNIDKAYVAGNDTYYFSGWDEPGSNTNGLAIWTMCRNAYLATGSMKTYSATFDSVQDAATIGNLFVSAHPDLGSKIRSICWQPRYTKITVYGNESAAAIAHNGNRYKPNPVILDAQGIPTSPTGAGIVVEEKHNYASGEHKLTIALPPLEGA